MLGASYWYWKTYQFQGFWATVFRLERLSNWLIANQYYLVKEVDEKEHRLSFNLGGEKVVGIGKTKIKLPKVSLKNNGKVGFQSIYQWTDKNIKIVFVIDVFHNHIGYVVCGRCGNK